MQLYTFLIRYPIRYFRLFKEPGVRIHPEIKPLTDIGDQSMGKTHPNSELPKKMGVSEEVYCVKIGRTKVGALNAYPRKRKAPIFIEA